MPLLVGSSRAIDKQAIHLPRPHQLALGALPVLMLLGLVGASDSIGRDCPTAQVIANRAALDAALKCAPPGTTLNLAAADFGTVEIRNPVTGLTIMSANPGQPAQLRGLSITGGSGVTVSSLSIGGPPPPGWRYAMLVFRSNGFTGRDLRFTGAPIEETKKLDSALMVRDLDGARLSGLQIRQHRNGITLLDVRNIDVSENLITNMQTDGIRGGGVNYARFTRNVIGNFHPIKGDHPDGIQLWSRNQTHSVQDILIEDNLVLRGGGSPIQGIFVSDRLGLPYRSLVIRRNLCVGTLYNGIMVMGGEGVTIADNAVIPLDPQISWIRVEKSRNVLLIGNDAGKYILKDEAPRMARNVAGPVRREADGEVRKWREKLNLPAADFPL